MYALIRLLAWALVSCPFTFNITLAQTTSPAFDSIWASKFDYSVFFAVEAGVQGVSTAQTWPGMGTYIGVGGISSEGKPITSDMRFGIGEQTRLFTSALALRLQEIGYFDLDDPLHQWLPAYTNIDGNATLRQCLTCQAGFFDFSHDIDPTDSAVVFGPDTFFTPEMILARVGSPHFPPGTAFRESSTGYLMVTLAIEAATGKSYVENLHEHILDPFGLDSTFIAPFEKPNGKVAEGWHFGVNLGDVPLPKVFSMYYGTGCIFMTASEMAQWMTMLFTGDIINEQSMMELLTFDPTSFYGLGLETTVYPPLPKDVIYVGRGNVPGYQTICGWDAKRKSATVVFTNLFDVNDNALTALAPFVEKLYFEGPKQSSDAGIIWVASPENLVCEEIHTPAIELENTGTSNLTSVEIHYRMDDGIWHQYDWNGNIQPGNTKFVTLPDIEAGPGEHVLHVFTAEPNHEPDLLNFNDSIRFQFYNYSGTPIVLGVHEEFESPVFPPAGWWQGGEDKFNWQRCALSLKHGASVSKNNFNDVSGESYTLSLPLVDLTSMNKPVLHYHWAYEYYPGYAYKLSVTISTDCNYTEVYLYNAAGEELKTADADFLFFPDTTQWQCNVIDLSEYKDTSLIKFIAQTANGNQLYLDHIEVNDALLCAAEKIEHGKLLMMPNPTQDKIDIYFPAYTTSTIMLYDDNGCLLFSQKVNGEKIVVDLSGYPDGLYVVRWTDGFRSGSEKLLLLR